MEHLRFENTKVFNFEGALRGMRNPKNSWHLSDSAFGVTDEKYLIDICAGVADSYIDRDSSDSDWDLKASELLNNGVYYIDEYVAEYNFIGAKDMKLAQALIRGGSEHRKFLRQIFVSVDITAPLYIWKEFDTYKVGTVANSTSTMHKLAETPITRDCFLLDSANDDLNASDVDGIWKLNIFIDDVIVTCETLRKKYLETKDIQYWRALIQLLPNSWMQTRTVTMNYENLLTICQQRRHHKLPEWREDFISWARTLPYAQEFIFIDETNE